MVCLTVVRSQEARCALPSVLPLHFAAAAGVFAQTPCRLCRARPSPPRTFAGPVPAPLSTSQAASVPAKRPAAEFEMTKALPNLQRPAKLTELHSNLDLSIHALAIFAIADVRAGNGCSNGNEMRSPSRYIAFSSRR